MNPTLIAIAEFLIEVARIYFLAGLIFTIPFLIFGVQKLDHSANWEWGFGKIVNGIGFRILVTPGMCIFWPLFALRLIRGKYKPTETNAHRLLSKQN
jgi:hypothetical protein